MSNNKSLQLQTVLTLGAAALALCASNGPGLAAGAGHAERAGGLARVVRGGGGGGELRSMGMNGQFDSVRVERLSPAAFTAAGRGDVPINAKRSPEPLVPPPAGAK